MNILIDTNVLLDIMLERKPFVEPAEQIFEAAKHVPIDLFMSATTVTDLYYIARKEKGHDQTLVQVPSNFVVTHTKPPMSRFSGLKTSPAWAFSRPQLQCHTAHVR